MGNFFSIENDFIAGEHQCEKISNDNIAYITKQYTTILKASSILNEIISGIKKSEYIDHPEIFLIDTSEALTDIRKGTPTNESKRIFTPIDKIIGIKNNEPERQLYTVLDQYNDYFIHDYNKLGTDSERLARAKLIKNNLDIASSTALTILVESCNILGKSNL